MNHARPAGPDVPHRGPASRLAGAALVLAMAVGAATGALACRFEPSGERLAGLSPEGDVALVSGGAARLADIVVVDAGGAAAMAARAALGPHAASFLAGAEPDRWRRRTARITLEPDGGAPRDLAAMLVAAGFARVDPGTAETLCDPTLLAREATARRAGRGMWRDPAFATLDAQTPERILERTGRFAIVEGRVVGVGERSRRTFIDFSRDWDTGFTVIAPARIWAELVARGLDAQALKGRRIRVRGIIQDWRGPAVELTTADFVEALDAERRRR